MTFNSEKVRNHLKTKDFKKLFIDELGWDNPPVDQNVVVDEQKIPLKAVAQKRGLTVFTCGYQIKEKLPDSNFRRKIDNQLTKYVREHLIIFAPEDNHRQEWQWVRRVPGKTSALRTASFNQGQSGEALIQKLRGLYFSLDEEEILTLTDTTSRVRAAFDVERVTKRFYELFKKEHNKFLSFIEGIPDEELQRWYASVMLNRLMFIYFLQKKNFLDNDANYLSNRLSLIKERKSGGYYKTILCPLFFEGFAKKEKERSKDVRALLGKIPYLNGGLFLKHQVEERYGDKINISDKAFDDLFAFFDLYQWHLDERPLKKDDEINPDVLGYIFEKYINQKQMGAYYTKEDITDYISKNTIIPWLFDAASKKCEIAFDKGSHLWNLLQANPEKYIFPAVRHGISWDIHNNRYLDKPYELPANIVCGLKNVSMRTDWNQSASSEYALPTETWREVVARRQRYENIKTKIIEGQIQSIEDFITCNLDIRQFARDVIDEAEGPELIRAFWKVINEITVLDPACGSGAFLFAALNILEDLYDACLDRMQDFVNDLEISKNMKTDKLKDFRETLKRIAIHPNEKYFVYKSIIIQNIYGVDIMEEATEICKLRLFLKLAAQLESPANIEPLPDIDFNIKAGNSLVGYICELDVKRSTKFKNTDEQFSLDFDDGLDKISKQAEDLDSAFTLFRKQQTKLGGEVTPRDKEKLKARLYDLEEELNAYLSQDYGISPGKNTSYEKWKESHQPFHWWVEFFGIMKHGGFDVIIGNPPYVEYTEIRDSYEILNFSTENCGNLYAFMIEKSLHILNSDGLFGMIVQLPIVCTDRMIPLQEKLVSCTNKLWFSNYDDRPARLFDGLEHIRATIFISKMGNKINNNSTRIFSTNYRRWYSNTRPNLFDDFLYENISDILQTGAIPKIGDPILANIFRKIVRFSTLGLNLLNGKLIYFHNAPQYWVRAMNFAPYFWNERDGEKLSTQIKRLKLESQENADATVAALNSSIFYIWFIALSDCRHLNLREIKTFPLGLTEMDRDLKSNFGAITRSLMRDFETNKNRKKCQYKKTGEVVYDEYFPKLSKSIIDQIDLKLAKHFDFTDEEVDFIINYDIKYRMGMVNGN